LEQHPKIVKVIYPGLPSHPQHALAKRQMRNFSGMLTFQTENGAHLARLFAKRLRTIHYAVSLGHHRSLMFYLPAADMLETPFHMTAAQEKSYRAFAGEGIFRFSVGLESPRDIIADIEQVLR
jgi:methionine-gamma-lyase